jgi:hypothetical protein
MKKNWCANFPANESLRNSVTKIEPTKPQPTTTMRGWLRFGADPPAVLVIVWCP